MLEKPILYNTDISYFSMITRLVLAEKELYAYSERLEKYWQRLKARTSFAKACIYDHMPIKTILRLVFKKILLGFL